MDFTALPMCTVLRLLHLSNALFETISSEFEIATEVRPVLEKAYAPILVIESGIVTVARLLRRIKAYEPILVTESADIVRVTILLQE